MPDNMNTNIKIKENNHIKYLDNKEGIVEIKA